jgi:hypothetical protein
LRFAAHEDAAQQLDAIAGSERPFLDEAIVFDPCPALRPHRLLPGEG